MRGVALVAELLVIVFLVALAFTTTAQVRHNLAAGPHGHAPHDPPVAAAGAAPGR